MKHRIIVCQGCGQRNRLPVEAWRADCGRCEKKLYIPGSTEKMLVAYAPRIVTAVGAVTMLGLFVSGVIEMLPGDQIDGPEARPASQMMTLADE